MRTGRGVFVPLDRRLVLNAYIPTLQTPGAVARFLREVCGKPILQGSGARAMARWSLPGLCDRLNDARQADDFGEGGGR